METIIEFINMAMEGLNNVGDNFDSLSERFTFWLVIAYLKAKLIALEFAYTIASGLIEGIGISGYLESAWAGLDSDVLAVFTYLRIPEGLNTLISAAMTRFVLDLMP